VLGSGFVHATPPEARGSRRVFCPESSQDEIFEEVKDLVENAMDGFHVCMMAYGQTGSGKSYTMEGTVQHPGLTPRAGVKLFDGSRADNGWNLNFQVSSFQVYRNQVEDLLVPDSGPVKRDVKVKGKSGNVEIKDLVKMKLSSAEEILHYFEQASEKRSTASTTMNETSSRSVQPRQRSLQGQVPSWNCSTLSTLWDPSR
jgi:kinesin family protein C1